MSTLLAVDLGSRCGLALYDEGGTLLWYRSCHFGSRDALKRAVFGIMRPIEGLSVLVLEGDRSLGDIWAKFARKWKIEVIRTGAERWRKDLLLSRQRTSGVSAKAAADGLARRVIAWSGAPRPTSLRHDAAEAILIGLWGLLQKEWLSEVPPEI